MRSSVSNNNNNNNNNSNSISNSNSERFPTYCRQRSGCGGSGSANAIPVRTECGCEYECEYECECECECECEYEYEYEYEYESLAAPTKQYKLNTNTNTNTNTNMNTKAFHGIFPLASLHHRNRKAVVAKTTTKVLPMLLVLVLLVMEAATKTAASTATAATTGTKGLARALTPAYRWGNFGQSSATTTTRTSPGHLNHRPLKDRLSNLAVRLRRKATVTIRNQQQQLLQKLQSSFSLSFSSFSLSSLSQTLLRAARAWVFWYFSKDSMASIYEDLWHAERDPEDFFGSGGMWISKGAHKSVVRRRIQRSKRNRQWVGLGYTPRLVWLVGVLLRGTFQCTAIPKVFNPKLTGWGAGTILGAKCTHQEWISIFMVGWFGSEYYWKWLFGCDGPPYTNKNKNGDEGFDGVPISITKVRIF